MTERRRSGAPRHPGGGSLSSAPQSDGGADPSRRPARGRSARGGSGGVRTHRRPGAARCGGDPANTKQRARARSEYRDERGHFGGVAARAWTAQHGPRGRPTLRVGDRPSPRVPPRPPRGRVRERGAVLSRDRGAGVPRRSQHGANFHRGAPPDRTDAAPCAVGTAVAGADRVAVASRRALQRRDTAYDRRARGTRCHALDRRGPPPSPTRLVLPTTFGGCSRRASSSRSSPGSP